jgi:protein-S-isoprenylcysteine O-methyltransferase Ste14
MNLLKSPWNLVFFAGFFVYLATRAVYARRANRLAKTHRRVDALEKFLLVTVISTSSLAPVLYLFSPWLAFADYRLPWFMPWCGGAVMVVALWLFWRSHADLGDNWSVTLELRKDHELITHGVYRSVRHPMYSGIFLFCIAQGLLLPNWLAGWSACVVFAVMYVLRTPREERMMCDIFGEEYRTYMARTGRLIPRILPSKSS